MPDQTRISGLVQYNWFVLDVFNMCWVDRKQGDRLPSWAASTVFVAATDACLLPSMDTRTLFSRGVTCARLVL